MLRELEPSAEIILQNFGAGKLTVRILLNGKTGSFESWLLEQIPMRIGRVSAWTDLGLSILNFVTVPESDHRL